MKTTLLSTLLVAAAAMSASACTPSDKPDSGPEDTGPSHTGDTGEGDDTGQPDSADTGDTGDTSDTSDTSETGDTSDTSDTSDTGDSGDTGPDLVATFTCAETSVVDRPMVLEITGAFDDATTPYNLSSVHVYTGVLDFVLDEARPVLPDDPNAAEITYWESYLHMTGWDVNPVDDDSGDRRFLFFPDGAEHVTTFDAFYYYVYGAGGAGQFEFSCVRD